MCCTCFSQLTPIILTDDSNQLLFLPCEAGNDIWCTLPVFRWISVFKEIIFRAQFKRSDCVSCNVCTCVTHAHNTGRTRPHQIPLSSWFSHGFLIFSRLPFVRHKILSALFYIFYIISELSTLSNAPCWPYTQVNHRHETTSLSKYTII